MPGHSDATPEAPSLAPGTGEVDDSLSATARESEGAPII